MATQERISRLKKVLSRRQSGFSVILDEIYDPFNISAIFRTCEGFGIKDIHVIKPPDGFKPSKPVCMKCEKWLDITYYSDRSEAYERLRKGGYAIYGTVLNRQSRDFREIQVDGPLCIVLGNEHQGLPEESISLCDGLIHIPMFGFVQSFNVSVTAAVILSEIVFRRGTSNPDLFISPAEQAETFKKWSRREHLDLIQVEPEK